MIPKRFAKLDKLTGWLIPPEDWETIYYSRRRISYDRNLGIWSYDHDMWELTPIQNLNELLKDGYVLCIAFRPDWYYWSALNHAIIGLDDNDQECSIYYEHKEASRQSALKSNLYGNRRKGNLLSPYIWASREESGSWTFKIIERRKLLAEHSNLDDALQELMPEGFRPYAEYRDIFLSRAFDLDRIYCVD